jgi:NarL family two-component system response regulator LiaR
MGYQLFRGQSHFHNKDRNNETIHPILPSGHLNSSIQVNTNPPKDPLFINLFLLETHRLPDVKIIVLTSFHDDDKVYQAIQAGAHSCLLKTTEPNKIVDAIRSVMRGQSILESLVAGKILSEFRRKKEPQPHDDLTPREMEVLRLIGEGKSNQEIADHLKIAIKTVKAHVTHVLFKLGVADRTQAAIYAHRNKLVD